MTRCKSLFTKIKQSLKRLAVLELFKGTLHYNGCMNTLLTTYSVKRALKDFLKFQMYIHS